MRFEIFLSEAGEAAGKMELVKTKVDDAYAFAKKLFDKKGQDIDKEFPNFKENYLFAQKQAGTGKTQRKDMPVIDEKDVKDFQKRLAKGWFDAKKPHAKADTNDKFTNKYPTDPNDPFPEGLTGAEAKQWLKQGVHTYDGDKQDDVIKATLTTETVGKLKPIQKQIYADKSIGMTIDSGIKATTDFLKNKSTFVISSDNYIIDGHHRYLSGLLVDPKMKVNVLRVEAPIKTLLPLSLAYGDAVGNKRNA